MERTHHGTISRKCTHFRQVCDHLFLGNLRADLFAKVLRYFFHLVWNGRIICAQIRVAFSRIYNHQAVILRAEIKINLLHNRRFRIFKIDRNQTADRACHLIEQTRRLVPELVFCIFSDVGVGDNIHLSLVKHRISHRADQHLIGSRRADARRADNIAGNVCVKSADLVSSLLKAL